MSLYPNSGFSAEKDEAAYEQEREPTSLLILSLSFAKDFNERVGWRLEMYFPITHYDGRRHLLFFILHQTR
jgi:hypothetical protein